MPSDKKNNDYSDLPLFEKDWSKAAPQNIRNSNLVSINEWKHVKQDLGKTDNIVSAYVDFAKKLDW